MGHLGPDTGTNSAAGGGWMHSAICGWVGEEAAQVDASRVCKASTEASLRNVSARVPVKNNRV